jgi:hypothetical protein
VKFLSALVICALATFTSATDKCGPQASYKIYSNAFLSGETEDVGGYELALKPIDGNGYEGLLYIYEGAPHEVGIELTGTRQGTQILLRGTSRQELIEHPGNQNVTETRHIKLYGHLLGDNFRGSVLIDGHSSQVSLRRVSHIWLCGPPDNGSDQGDSAKWTKKAQLADVGTKHSQLDK